MGRKGKEGRTEGRMGARKERSSGSRGREDREQGMKSTEEEKRARGKRKEENNTEARHKGVPRQEGKEGRQEQCTKVSEDRKARREAERNGKGPIVCHDFAHVRNSHETPTVPGRPSLSVFQVAATTFVAVDCRLPWPAGRNTKQCI